jgi:hypothetical protein
MNSSFYVYLSTAFLTVSCQTQTSIPSPNKRSQTPYVPEAEPSTLTTPPPAKLVTKDFFSVGASMDDVAAIMGTPSRISDFSIAVWWYYGDSKVVFQAGRVTEWDNESNNLKVRWSSSSPPIQARTSALRQPSATSPVRSTRLLLHPDAGSGLDGWRYINTGDGHWIKSKSDDGDIITLEDGSIWQVDLLDRIEAKLWLPLTDITVIESAIGYLLINTDDGEQAHAKLLSQ